MTTQPGASLSPLFCLTVFCILAASISISYYVIYLDFIYCLSQLLLNDNMNSRGTKLLFMELEEMARWIIALALLIGGSEFEPPALTKKAWCDCSTYDSTISG